MESRADPDPFAVSGARAAPAFESSIPELVGRVYESAPPEARRRLIEQLLRPLGVLSLFGVAGGIFARARLRGGWVDPRIRIEDLQAVRADDVVALVDFAQQVSVEAIDGLALWLSASPAMAGSADAALLGTLLLHPTRGEETGKVLEWGPVPHR
jgi:hypothetical protein